MAAVVLVVMVTLGLCWWPFNFCPANDVHIDPAQGKAWFNMGQIEPGSHTVGHAFTTKPLHVERKKGVTIRLMLTPLATPKGLGCILVLHDGGQRPPLVVAQWQEHFALFVRALEAGKGYREVGLKQVLPVGKTVALTIVSLAQGTTVYADGRLAGEFGGFSLFETDGWANGRLILGNNQFGTEPWHGSIERVVVEEGADPSNTQRSPTGRPLFALDFSLAGDAAARMGASPVPLIVPERFRPLAPKILALPERRDLARNSTWHDFFWNVLGFVPVSACFSLLAGNWVDSPGWRFSLTVLAALCFSLLIESGQVLLPWRHSSLLDLLSNTTGALILAMLVWWRNTFPFIRKYILLGT